MAENDMALPDCIESVTTCYVVSKIFEAVKDGRTSLVDNGDETFNVFLKIPFSQKDIKNVLIEWLHGFHLDFQEDDQFYLLSARDVPQDKYVVMAMRNRHLLWMEPWLRVICDKLPGDKE